MTALDTPFNPGTARGQAPQAGRLGIQVTPSAPGLVPTPAVSGQGSKLRQAIDAITLAGQVGRTAANLADNEVRRREFEQHKFDRMYEAAASVEARVALASIEQRINDGQVVVPEGVEVGDFAAQLAQAQLPDNAPDAFKARYQAILVPEVARRITSKQSADIEQARRESVQLLSQGVYSSAGTVEDMLDFVAAAKAADPGLTDLEAKAAVLLPTLQTAIEQGDRTTFDLVAKALGSDFATTISRARLQLEDQRLRNERRQETRDMTRATEIVDSLIDSPFITDASIRESIDGMQLDATNKAVLKDRLSNRRAAQLASERSDQRRLLESIHDAATSPDQFRRALERNAEALGLSAQELDREVMVYTRSRIELAANRGNMEEINALAPTLGGGPDAQLLLDEARSVATNVIRDRRFQTVVTGLQAGEVEPEVVRAFVVADAKKAIDDPDSPDVLTAAQRARLTASVGEREQLDESLLRVDSVLSGNARAIITPADDSAIDRLLGPQEAGGHGLIDIGNNIADPVRLGASVAALDRVTAQTREVVMANLMRGQPDQQVLAIAALEEIARSRPALLMDFVSEGDQSGAAISEIRMLADRGIIPERPGVARERVASRISALADSTLNRREVDARIESDKVNLDSEVEKVLGRAADQMPWHNPPGPLNERSIADINDEVDAFVRAEFKRQYFYQASQGVSKGEAAKFARRTTQEMLVRNFDFVEFNGELHVHRVFDGQNRLPSHLRWGEDYGRRVELFIKDKGLEIDDVFTVRPAFGSIDSTGQPLEGWILVNHALDPITDEQGRELVWVPPRALWDKTEQFRDLMDTKDYFYQFNRPNAKPERTGTFEGLDPTTIQSIP